MALVRRGHDTAAAARAFLAADEEHDPSEFDGIDGAVDAIRAAIAGDQLITIHGDYDVDGVTATTILVTTLRDLGARCDWLIPDRLADGYGLTTATLERLAARGTGLLITADCGITSVAEVAAARELGIARCRDRPPPAGRRAAGLPDRPSAGRRVPVPGPLRGRRGPQARERPRRPRAGGARPRPGRAGHGRRHGPADGREPDARPAWAGAGPPRPPARAARPDGRRLDRPRAPLRGGSGLPPGATNQRGRAAPPRRRRGRALPGRGRGPRRADR